MWLTEVARLSRALKVAGGPHLFELNYLASLFPEKVAASNREHTGNITSTSKHLKSSWRRRLSRCDMMVELITV